MDQDAARLAFGRHQLPLQMYPNRLHTQMLQQVEMRSNAPHVARPQHNSMPLFSGVATERHR